MDSGEIYQEIELLALNVDRFTDIRIFDWIIGDASELLGEAGCKCLHVVSNALWFREAKENNILLKKSLRQIFVFSEQ
jgi:hypothetical protein